MMHVPTGPDGERERSWMTAGVLCVHGAEQGETLYGTAQLLSPALSFSLSLLSFLLLTNIHKIRSSQWSCYSLQVSPEPVKPHRDLKNGLL